MGDIATLASTLSTVALNYTHGQGLSTLYIVPQTVSGNIIYFAMPARLSANVIFDVVGYFAVSQVTKLECVYPSIAGVGPVASGAALIIRRPAATQDTQSPALLAKTATAIRIFHSYRQETSLPT